MTMTAERNPVTQLGPTDIGPEVLAKKNGDCKFCPDPIIAFDDYIRKTRAGWLHSRCASEYVRVQERVRSENNDDGNDEDGTE